MKLKSENGFFSIHFILIISLISTSLISYNYIFYAQKQKNIFLKFCYIDLVQIQKNIIQLEKQLFLLNPESTALRLRMKFLYYELVAASAAQNYPLVAKISLDIKNTYDLQKKLDFIQKSIIAQAHFTLKTQILNLNKEIIKLNTSEEKIWNLLIRGHRNYGLKLSSVVAIKADSIDGLAPNYELQDQYKTLQMLKLTLQHAFTNKKETQNLLEAKKSFHFYCEVSFTKKEDQWHLKINQDKLL